MIKGTESDRIIDILLKKEESIRKRVKEVTLDLAPTMEKIVKKSFPRLPTAFMFNNLPVMLFNKSELTTDGKPLSKKIKKWSSLKKQKAFCG